MSDIDPIAFGELKAKVAALEEIASEQSRKLDELLAIANRGKGVLWAATLLAGGVGAGAAALLKRLAS